MTYTLQSYSKVLGWHRVTGAHGKKGYVQGWMDALTSLYPCPPYRIVEGLDGKVVEEHRGNSRPKPAHEDSP